MKFILGQKIRMSQIFDEEGAQVPVTMVEAGPCRVLQIKTKERNGYEAVQIGFKELKESRTKKTQKDKPFKFIREFRVPLSLNKSKDGESLEYKAGQEISVSLFKEGEKIDVVGISKGKGFQGGVKRWGFHGRPATHGTKHEERKIGSIGSAPLAKVQKGKKMPGRMGKERKTVKNLKIAKIDSENNVLFIKGAVPGRKGTLLELKTSR